jgi:hypothetical protein
VAGGILFGNLTADQHVVLPGITSKGKLEDTITTAQHVSEKTVQALREQLNQDIKLLASLNPKSAAYERLSAHIDQRTIQLLDYEDQRERQRRAAEFTLAEE